MLTCYIQNIKIQASLYNSASLGGVAQSVTYLTADPVVKSLIPALTHSFVEIYHEIVSKVIFLPSTDSRRVVVSNKQKYVHEVLVNRIVQLAQEKKCG